MLPEKYTLVGGGSNIIINPNSNKYFIKVSSSFYPLHHSNNILTCSAGASISQTLKYMVNNNLTGLEFSAGVPATIGGMVYMNFECWGHQISDIVHSVLIYNKTNGIHWIKKEDYSTDYRWTSFQDQQTLILAVKLMVSSSTQKLTKTNIQKNIVKRKEKQPLFKSTFGSVFKNPPTLNAGQLIEKLNLKGFKIGDAMISNHHANFIENINSATFDDTFELIKTVQNKILKHYNVKLECEVKIIN